jgi:hypothetical protein
MQCFAHRVFGCFEVPAQWQYTGQTSAEVSVGKICFQFSAQFVINGFKHIKIFPSGLKHILFNRIFCLFSAVAVVLKYDTDTNLSTILHACQEAIGNIFSDFSIPNKNRLTFQFERQAVFTDELEKII